MVAAFLAYGIGLEGGAEGGEDGVDVGGLEAGEEGFDVLVGEDCEGHVRGGNVVCIYGV